MHLEQLRKQAKELVKAARAGEAEALARLEGEKPILARAQRALAREHGFPSWPALVVATEASVERFIRAATDGRRARAEAMLTAKSEIADDPWAGLVLGRVWEGDVNASGGPRGWAPLVYVAHSCLPDVVSLARELLARGADPNAFFVNEYGRMSVLYGAAGRRFDPELTRALLEAGADPDDGESLYHAAAAPAPDCLRILLEFGAPVRESNALGHVLDYEHPEHLRALLRAPDADPNEAAFLAHAVRRERSPTILRMLVEHGADVDAPGGETWRGDVPLRTPYQHAVLRGRDDQVQALAELGADTTVSVVDRAVATVAAGGSARLPDSLDVDQQEVLILAALRGQVDAVVDAVGANFRGVVGGSPEGGLIDHAAFVGAPGVVERLIAAGADPRYALGWAAHGSSAWEIGNRDYVAVAKLIGGVPEPDHREVAAGPLAEYFDEL